MVLRRVWIHQHIRPAAWASVLTVAGALADGSSFGAPTVREVEIGLVLEVAFDSVQRSTRHKSGVALRFPRISRLRWDKPAAEADRLETLVAMIPPDPKPGSGVPLGR